MKTFLEEYIQVLAASVGADFDKNHDSVRFGPEAKASSHPKEISRRFLARLGLVSVGAVRQTIDSGLGFVEPHLPYLEWLYAKLQDAESRNLAVNLAAYRALGNRKIKLPLNNPEHWDNLRRAEALKVGKESIPTGFMNLALCEMDLSKIGYPIKLFALPGVVVVDFVEQQYRCETSDGAIECKEDDYVVDAGGCWADTALYFAHKVGPKGRVASFEFLPDNLKVVRRNLEMNPVLAERVAVYEHPVWSQSGKELFVIGNGPATRVVPHTGDPNAFRIKTLKIDDLVARGEFPRVDFIKMDIEGAELEALKGSEAVLRMFKPRLAITVYHDFKDMWSIPNYLDSLGLGYRFYLRHFTIHAEETVLFARA